MEMSQIRYALAAAKTLNFTKAAAECNVSQPALTKAVKTLEADLGAPLFHREGKRILLSEFGRSMVPHLQHIIDEAEVTRTLADNFRLLNKVPVRIGVMSTVGHVRLSRFLATFQQEFEGVEVAVTEASVADLKTALDEGEIDIAIMNALDDPGDAYLVDHLGKLAGAGRAHQGDRLAVAIHHRLGLGEGRLLPAAHDGELAVDRARLAARNRRIDEAESRLLGLRLQLARQIGRGRGVVDEDRALLHAGEGAVLAVDDRTHVVVVADAAEHDVAVLGRRRRGRRLGCPRRRI